MHVLRGLVDTPVGWTTCVPNQRQNCGSQGSTIAIAIGPPSHRRLMAPFSPPVCVPCGKWPKFMIACILGPRLDGRRNPVPNEMPPCKNNKCGVWTRVCVVIVSAMQVMLRRGGFFCFRLVRSLVDPTNCGSHRCHALTHFSCRLLRGTLLSIS